MGLVEFGVVATLPVATLWVLLHADEIGERAVALGRRLRLVPPPRILTYDPPVERLAADLRRLSAGIRDIPQGMSNVRRRGMLLAYDDLLMSACRALDVPHSLNELGQGMDRDLERLRVESCLEEAGLRFRVPS